VGEVEPSSRAKPSGPGRREGTPWKRIAFAVLVVYATLIVILNHEQVEVSFVFFSTKISLLVLILVCVGLGFAAGYLFDDVRARRKRSRSSA
jgi:uncharacterized integral membrane protein